MFDEDEARFIEEQERIGKEVEARVEEVLKFKEILEKKKKAEQVCSIGVQTDPQEDQIDLLCVLVKEVELFHARK